MNKLYLAMLSVVFGCANINAHRVDDGTTNMPLTGDEYIIKFRDAHGDSCAAFSTHPVDPELVRVTLTPNNNVYDLRPFQRAERKHFLKSLPFFTRHGGKLGMTVGATAAAGAALILYGFMDGFMDSFRW